MNINDFFTIDDSEVEPFKNALNKYNYQKQDFNFNHKDLTSYQPNLKASTLRGKITITYVATNKTKTYDTGSGSTWVYQFENDLKNNYFK